MTAAEYLAWERAQATKHEYHLGNVFAMPSGSPRHNVLSTAVAAELRAALRGAGCHVLSSDQRISAREGQADGSWRYRLLAPGDRVTLANGAALEGDAIYEGAFELPGDG